MADEGKQHQVIAKKLNIQNNTVSLWVERWATSEEVEVRERGEDDVFTILIDPSKTNQDFDWKVSTPLEDGIKAAIEWYKKFGITQTYTHLQTEE